MNVETVLEVRAQSKRGSLARISDIICIIREPIDAALRQQHISIDTLKVHVLIGSPSTPT